MASFWDRFRRRLDGETELFRTHRAAFQEPERSVGSLVEHEGDLYVVTRWEELPAVPLARGGSVREWRVWGRTADPEAVERMVARAAEKLLDGPGETEGDEG